MDRVERIDMSYTLDNLLTDVNDRTAGESGTVTRALVTRYSNESLRRLRRKFDIPNAEVVSQLQLMSRVYFYAAPYSGYKEFVALRDNYQMNDKIFMRNVSEDTFWSNFVGGNTKSESRNGESRRLLFNLVSPHANYMTVNNLMDVTTDGTWVASADASNARKDTLFFREGTSSFEFDIVPSTGTATLTNSTMTAKDLSGDAFKLTAMLSLWVYLPVSTSISTATLRFGSSASDYYQVALSSLAQIDGSALTVGWNQIGFDWQNKTTVGTPDSTAVDYLQLSFTFPLTIGTQTGIRLNMLRAHQRRIVNLHSTTDFLIIDGTTGLPKETFTSYLDTSSYFNIDRDFTDFVLYEILEQVFTTHINDPDARAEYTRKRMELEQDLIMRFPSKRQPEVQQYAEGSIHDYWLKR
jgi:hypothetical protein